MNVFIDTTGYFSLLDRDERNHQAARQIWQRLLDNDDVLITSNYVLVEMTALAQNRLGMAASADFNNTFVPLAKMVWIDAEIHLASVTALLTANRRQLSLVDCVSFEVCRRLNIHNVFAFDQHFEEQGFSLLSV